MDSPNNSKRGRKSGKEVGAGAPRKRRSRRRGRAETGGVEGQQEVQPQLQSIPSTSATCCRPLVALLDGRDCSVEMPILKDISTVAFCDATSITEIHGKVLNEARGVFMWDKIQLSAEELERFRSLKIIVKMGPGVDNIDLEAAADLGIAVCHVNDSGIEEIADTTIGMMLDLYRKISWFDKMEKAGEKFRNFESLQADRGSSCVRIRGETLGLIGLGRVGTAVSLRAKVFGFNVIFYDPYLKDGVEKSYGLTRAYTLAELLAQSDCISLHCGLNEHNGNIINEFTIRQMRPGAFVVNVSNSKLIDEGALATALQEGKIQGAALNTAGFDMVGGPLNNAPNLTCNPNVAFLSQSALGEFRNAAASEMRRGIIDGVPGTLKYLVNREHLRKAGIHSSVPSPPGVPPNFGGNYYAAAAYAAAVAAQTTVRSAPDGAAH
ncbi:unnamed protein product [Orchesella dallaii]|uniref:C-terminal-binding protein n=1 Tax=Orchesella dallaii TaxID=48710 RepID=A0ABP1QAL5_9HEXA